MLHCKRPWFCIGEWETEHLHTVFSRRDVMLIECFKGHNRGYFRKPTVPTYLPTSTRYEYVSTP